MSEAQIEQMVDLVFKDIDVNDDVCSAGLTLLRGFILGIHRLRGIFKASRILVKRLRMNLELYFINSAS